MLPLSLPSKQEKDWKVGPSQREDDWTIKTFGLTLTNSQRKDNNLCKRKIFAENICIRTMLGAHTQTILFATRGRNMRQFLSSRFCRSFSLLFFFASSRKSWSECGKYIPVCIFRMHWSEQTSRPKQASEQELAELARRWPPQTRQARSETRTVYYHAYIKNERAEKKKAERRKKRREREREESVTHNNLDSEQTATEFNSTASQPAYNSSHIQQPNTDWLTDWLRLGIIATDRRTQEERETPIFVRAGTKKKTLWLKMHAWKHIFAYRT